MDTCQAPEQEYDVIVVGAGPAGGQCARDLAKSGKHVLLVEKAKDFSVNNFSSAGAPLEIMEAFDLPEEIIGAFWRRLRIYTSREAHCWQVPRRRGVVLDFLKLRAFLADETAKHGGDVLLGFSYQRHEVRGGGTAVWLKDQRSGLVRAFRAGVLVDATGCERRVLAHKSYDKKSALVGTAIEYLVQTASKVYQDFAEALSIFMGLKWMPQGYGWVFPMQPNCLKVGVGRNFPREKIAPHRKSILFYLEQLMRECLHTKEMVILDKHGKTLTYSYRRADPHFEGSVVAVGDSVSTVNPLTFEGIRHAMMSGRIAARHVLGFLKGDRRSFKRYEREIRRYCGVKWLASEILMRNIYLEPEDEKIDLMLVRLKDFSFDEMMDLAFHYRLGKSLKFYLGYKFLAARRYFGIDPRGRPDI